MPAVSELHELLERPHYGNGTGCQCCKLVDDGHLARLLAIEEAARRVSRAARPKSPSESFELGAAIGELRAALDEDNGP